MKLCIEHKIYIVFLCPYTLYICQPNDLGPYSHLKRAYKSSLAFTCTSLCESFSGRKKFLYAYYKARNNAFSQPKIQANWSATNIWPRNRNKVLQSHWMIKEPRTPVSSGPKPVIPVQSTPQFDEITFLLLIKTPKSSRNLLKLKQQLYGVNKLFAIFTIRLLFRKMGKALDIGNAKLAESRFQCATLTESLKKARPKKRKAIEIKVQNGFMQLMDVHRIKIAIRAVSNTFTPVINENFVNNMEEKSNEIRDEIIIRKAYSNSEFGSNYSNGA
jgi:hypothetical protein